MQLACLAGCGVHVVRVIVCYVTCGFSGQPCSKALLRVFSSIIVQTTLSKWADRWTSSCLAGFRSEANWMANSCVHRHHLLSVH